MVSYELNTNKSTVKSVRGITARSVSSSMRSIEGLESKAELTGMKSVIVEDPLPESSGSKMDSCFLPPSDRNSTSEARSNISVK